MNDGKINPNIDAGAVQGKQIIPAESVKEAKELSPLAKDSLKTSDEIKASKALPAIEDPKIEEPNMSLIPKVITKDFTEGVHDSLKDLIDLYAELRSIIRENNDLVIRFEKKVVTAIIEGRYDPELLNEFLEGMDEDKREEFKRDVKGFANYYLFENIGEMTKFHENTMAHLILLLLSLQANMSKNKLSESLARIRDHVNKLKNADTSSGLKKTIREIEAKESDAQAMIGIGKMVASGGNMILGSVNHLAVAREIKNNKTKIRDELKTEIGLPPKEKDKKYPDPIANADKFKNDKAKAYAKDYNEYLDNKEHFKNKTGPWDPSKVNTGGVPPAEPVKPRLSASESTQSDKVKSLRKDLASWKTSEKETQTHNNIEQTYRRTAETFSQIPEVTGGFHRGSLVRERTPHEADKEKLDHMMDLHNKETDSKTEYLNQMESFIDNLHRALEKLDQTLMSSNPMKS